MDDDQRFAVMRSLAGAQRFERPFPHWILEAVFDPAVIERIRTLRFKPAFRYGDGTRASLPPASFLNEEACRRYPEFLNVIESLWERESLRLFEQVCGLSLSKASLRVSYHVDGSGFWLRPHTDIPEKLLTLVVLVEHHPSDVAVGTELYDGTGALCKRAPSIANTGVMFVPAKNTFHGFTQRFLNGPRSTLVINFVSEAWRNIEELAPAYPLNMSGVAQ